MYLHGNEVREVVSTENYMHIAFVMSYENTHNFNFITPFTWQVLSHFYLIMFGKGCVAPLQLTNVSAFDIKPPFKCYYDLHCIIIMYMCMIFLTSTLHNNSQNAIIQLHVSYIVIAIRAISGPILGALVMQDQLILSGQPGSNGNILVVNV